jgi:hypothetical protein
MDERAAVVVEATPDEQARWTDEELSEVVISRETMWAWAAEEAA